MAFTVVRIEQAPFSPYVRQGLLLLDELEAVPQEVTGTYKLRGAHICNGLGVPEVKTEEVVVKPLLIRAGGGGNGNFMY